MHVPANLGGRGDGFLYPEVRGVEEDWLAKGAMSRSSDARSIARRSGLLRRAVTVAEGLGVLRVKTRKEEVRTKRNKQIRRLV